MVPPAGSRSGLRDAPSLVLLLHPPQTRRLSILRGFLRRIGCLVLDGPAQPNASIWDYVVPDVVLVRLERASGADAAPILDRLVSFRHSWPESRFLITVERTLSPAELSLTTLIGSTVLYHPSLEAIAMLLLS